MEVKIMLVFFAVSLAGFLVTRVTGEKISFANYYFVC